MERVRSVVAVAVYIAISWWGLTYVPVIQDHLPNLIVAPDSTYNLVLSDADVAAGKVPTDQLNGPCHDIPFLLRPIANPPDRVHVVFSYQGHDVGEGLYDCHDMHEIRSTHF